LFESFLILDSQIKINNKTDADKKAAGFAMHSDARKHTDRPNHH